MNKYRAVPTVVDGIRFASKKEARRYRELKLLHRSGKVSNLRTQVSFPIIINGEKVCTYIADFVYGQVPPARPAWDFQTVVEDVKGVKTSTYRLKAKLMKAVHGIKIKET